MLTKSNITIDSRGLSRKERVESNDMNDRQRCVVLHACGGVTGHAPVTRRFSIAKRLAHHRIGEKTRSR